MATMTPTLPLTGTHAITGHEAQQLQRANATGQQPVMFVHGLWLLASSWDRWAAVFEEAGYVTCTKTFSGRTPRTDYKLTASGRRAFEKYLDHMDALIRAARKG